MFDYPNLSGCRLEIRVEGLIIIIMGVFYKSEKVGPKCGERKHVKVMMQGNRGEEASAWHPSNPKSQPSNGYFLSLSPLPSLSVCPPT